MDKHDLRFTGIMIVLALAIGAVLFFGSSTPLGMAGKVVGSEDYCSEVLEKLENPNVDSDIKAKLWEYYDSNCLKLNKLDI